MNRVAAVALVVVFAGCSKKQPVVKAPPPPRVQVPPAPRRATPHPPKPAERARTEREPPAPSPRTLEALASADDRAAHVQRIQASIRTAEKNLFALQTRQPEANTEELARVQSLIRQARAAQAANDLPSAQSFAQRAEILAADLVSR